MPETAVHVASGKVREIYELDADRLLLVASDRISTFDVVLPTEIPDKGRVLTGLSAFWFARTRDDLRQPPAPASARTGARPSAGGSRCCRSSASSAATSPAPAGRTTSAPARRRATCSPTGCASRTGCPEPIFTPSTKAVEGHDENIDAAAAAAARRRGALPRGRARCSIELYRVRLRPRRRARDPRSPTRSSSSASTRTATLVLADEAFTPDSSRFWPADEYEPGRPQPSFDKQYVRDYCETLGWDKTPPGPELPDEIVAGTRRRYVEAFERLTGLAFDDYLADPEIVLR